MANTLKIATAVASPIVVAASEYLVPMWGTGPYTFFLAALGSAMSYVWDAREDHGILLIIKTVCLTLFCVALVVVLPDVVGLNLQPKTEPPLAFILSLYGRHIYAAFRHAAPNLGKAISKGLANAFRGGRSHDDYNDKGY